MMLTPKRISAIVAKMVPTGEKSGEADVSREKGSTDATAALASAAGEFLSAVKSDDADAVAGAFQAMFDVCQMSGDYDDGE